MVTSSVRKHEHPSGRRARLSREPAPCKACGQHAYGLRQQVYGPITNGAIPLARPRLSAEAGLQVLKGGGVGLIPAKIW